MRCTRCLRFPAPNVQTRRDSLFMSQHFYGNNIIAKLSNSPAVPISLKQMMSFGENMTEDKLIQAGNFVRQELPVRIAHRIRDLQNLPFVVGLNPNLERVYISYLDAFERIRKFPQIKNLNDNDLFCESLKSLLESHWGTIPRMMVGLLESSASLPSAARERFMTRMLRSRIARRVLAEQHIALTTQYHEAIEHGPIQDANQYIGIINTNLSPYKSIKSLEKLLPQVTGIQTTIQIDNSATGGGEGGGKGKKNVKDIKFAFIEDHLQYIVFELVKNSVLAALENGRIDKAQFVNVTISESENLIGIRVSDESGGISPEYQPPVYSKDDRPLMTASRSGLLNFSHPYQNYSPNKQSHTQPQHQNQLQSQNQTNQKPQQQQQQQQQQSLTRQDYLNQFKNTPRIGATISEQLGSESDLRLGKPGHRIRFGLSLGLCRVYAEYFGGHLDLFTLDGYGSDAYLTIPKLGTRAANI